MAWCQDPTGSYPAGGRTQRQHSPPGRGTRPLATPSHLRLGGRVYSAPVLGGLAPAHLGFWVLLPRVASCSPSSSRPTPA